MSGFRKTDKLLPCITIVLYYGDNWDGSKDLYGLLDFSDIPEELHVYVNNYSLHVFEVKKFADEDTNVFRTDLKQIFDFIRYSKDRKRLQALVENDPAYCELDEDAYDMMLAYTNDKELLARKETNRKDGKVNMCQAIREWIEDERRDSKIEGKIEGRKLGIELGIEAFIMDHQEDGTPRECVAEKLIRRFELNKEMAEKYLLKYNYV